MERVILGMPGPWAKDFSEASDHYTTKMGGLPDWPIPREDIKSDLLKCGVCRGYLGLIAQVYAPLLNDTLKVEERIIYVLGCPTQKCGSSWRILRVQKSLNAAESSTLDYANMQLASEGVLSSAASQEVARLPESSGAVSKIDDLWEEDSWTCEYGEDHDYENEGVLDLQELRKAFSEIACLASHNGKQSGLIHCESVKDSSSTKTSMHVIDANTPVFPCFYIYSQEDQSSYGSSAVSAAYSSLSIKESEKLLESCGGEDTWEEEGYEYDRALNADRVYLKFKKRLDAYPEQCFRYSYGGKSLLASKDLGEPGSCGLCGAPRHYEMQLMPPLLYFLQQATDGSSIYSPADWNWLTLIIYTCSESCSLPYDKDRSGSSPWLVAEEAAIIQYE